MSQKPKYSDHYTPYRELKGQMLQITSFVW